ADRPAQDQPALARGVPLVLGLPRRDGPQGPGRLRRLPGGRLRAANEQPAAHGRQGSGAARPRHLLAELRRRRTRLGQHLRRRPPLRAGSAEPLHAARRRRRHAPRRGLHRPRRGGARDLRAPLYGHRPAFRAGGL
ncbi:MAG: hypothetical protein AVDCRST_MAG08-2918, partial [uncultured Acetobacteraceae bacterium]